ncbi:ABC transporter substrate-binding protein [Mesorhizobium sp. ArgA1]
MSFASAETPAGTIVMAKQIDDIVSLDPAEAYEPSGLEALGNIYDNLVAFDVKDVSKIYGALAESWTVSVDGKTFTFKLRPGLKFHSGNPVTAADVAYSIERVVALNKSPAFILAQFGFTKDNAGKTVKVIDDRTVAIMLDKPYAPTFFLNCMTATVAAVVDSKVVKEHVIDGDYGNAWMKQHSAGSGAYILRAWRAIEQYTLDANPNWYRRAPKNKRVVVRHAAEPAAQRLLLEKGDVDFARNLSKDQIAAVSSEPAIAVEAGDKGYILYLGLNQKNPNLAKPEVAEALKWLVDYDAIEKNIVAGTFKAHQAYLPTGFLGAITDKPYRFDLAKGKELLAKAGLANGFTVTMDVRSTAPYPDIAQAIQASWAQAGIKLELIPGDAKQVVTRYRARKHDIFLGPWGPDYQDPNTNANAFALNPDNADDAKVKSLAWRNAWNIPAMTKQTQDLKFEQDAGKRVAGYEASEREHQKVSPFVVMFQQIEVAVHRKGVEGFVIGPTSDTNYYSNIAKH